MVGVDGREDEAGEQDEHEDAQEGERDVVPAQPPPGEVPRAPAADRGGFRLRGSELRRGVDAELALCPLCHLVPSGEMNVGDAGTRRPRRLHRDYLWQIVA